MATAENVTAIRPDAAPPRDPPAETRRPRRPPAGVRLSESGEFDGFMTIDVLNGLHGVCLALDLVTDASDFDQGELATAARVLASILQNRVDS